MGGKRIKLLLVYFITIVIGIPVWWKATEIYRADLPFDDVHAWAAGQKWELFEKLSQQFPLNTHGKAVKAATGYRVSFTLANADPTYIIPEWDFHTLQQVYLDNILDKLSVVADFAIESQVFHYASLLKKPLQETSGSQTTYYIPENSIHQYINPNEWKLDFSIDTKPIINFIVYIPSNSHSPLKIRTENKEYAPANAYIIPQWGGVKIYNPTLVNNSETNKMRLELSTKDLAEVFSIFVAQLKELLSGSYSPALSPDEYDLIIKRHLSENIQTSLSTLLSLSKMVDSLPNMVVLDNIGLLVQTSIDSLNKAHTCLQTEDYLGALKASREALRTSEEAFFDPNMLSLLYFPDEHKYSVYTPILLPVAFSLLGGVVQEYKHYKAKKLKQKEHMKTE